MKKSQLIILLMGIAFFIWVGNAAANSATLNNLALQDMEISSPEELIDLLAEVGGENFEEAFDPEGGIITIEACKNVSITPSAIVATKPFRFKFYQITVNITIWDCGNILCSQMGFDMTWSPGPSAGAILIGPMPSEPPGQVCVGNSTSTKGYLILTKDVPNGSYKIQIKVGGFASADYWYLPVTVN